MTRAGKILIEVTASEMRVAVLEHGSLIEYFTESKASTPTRVGQIHRSEVVSLVPSLNAAFVRLYGTGTGTGTEQMGFLHVSEIPHELVLKEHIEALETGRNKREANELYPDISRLLKVGQRIDVQILKDGVGRKGPKVTGFLSVPGKYLVRLEGVPQVMISKRLDREEERDRLRALALDLTGPNHGFIVRTSAESCSQTDLRDDAAELEAIWQKLENARQTVKGDECAMLYGEESLVSKVLRDIYKGDRMDIVVAGGGEGREWLETLPTRDLNISVHDEESPGELFSLYKIDEQLASALRRLVRLPSGATIVIDTVEAMTVVDVNTGRNVSNANTQQTILKTNVEAAREIARQIRLRNIGGVIVIDFVDMHFAEDRKFVLETLEAFLKFDRFQTKVYPFTELGLVQVTRKRSSYSLKQQLTRTCGECGGAGVVRRDSIVT